MYYCESERISWCLYRLYRYQRGLPCLFGSSWGQLETHPRWIPFSIRSHSKPTQPGTSSARDLRITAEDSTQGVSFRKRMAGVRVSLVFWVGLRSYSMIMSQSDVTFVTSTTLISEVFGPFWTYSKSGSHIFLATRGGVGVENIKHGSMLCFVLCAPGPA